MKIYDIILEKTHTHTHTSFVIHKRIVIKKIHSQSLVFIKTEKGTLKFITELGELRHARDIKQI